MARTGIPFSCPHFDEAIDQIEKARSINEELRGDLIDALEENEHLRTEIEDLQKEIEDLEEQLEAARDEAQHAYRLAADAGHDFTAGIL